MNSRIDFIILSFILIAFIGCKDSPVSPIDEIPSETVDEALVILNQLELDFEGFEMTYFKSIVESNGIDKLWILETEELWNTNLIVKDTINKQIKVYFKINSSGKEKFENCDNFYTNNCSTSEQNVRDTTSSVFIFDIQKNSIQVDFSPHYSTDTDTDSISSEENVLSEILIDFDFFKSDTTEIIIEELFTTIYNPSNYSIQLNSNNGSSCKFWKFSLSKTEVNFDSQNHKNECAPEISEIKDYFDQLFPVSFDETLEFEYEIIALSGWTGELYGTEYNSSEFWRLKETLFSEEKIEQTLLFEVSSYSKKIKTWESYDEDYEPEITFDTTYSESIIVLNYLENKASFYNRYLNGFESFKDYFNFSFSYDFENRKTSPLTISKCLTTHTVGGGACAEGRTKKIDPGNKEFINSYFDNISSNFNRRFSYYHGIKQVQD